MVIKASRVLLVATSFAFGAPAFAQEQFSTPEAAVDALITAAKAGEQQAIIKILGPEGELVVSSGDPVADANIRDAFVASYDAKHAIEMEGDGTQTLILGNDDWPFPIPLVNKAGEWQFDTIAGLVEILSRRIGRNELSAIQVLQAYVQAQNEYAALDPAGLGRGVYAQRIVSRPGKKDGLYWPTTGGEAPSPLGDLAAKASAEGYKAGDKPIPYHGYYYRILTRQGAGAPGGAYDYLVKGKMMGGFALIAYPAEYGNSGIMTFVVNHDGTVFEKDLGTNTPALARKIDAFAPEQTWTKVDSSQ
ncbi:MAG TPA: DUF2950 domain-containing protein [Methyloceanibacter sp.]|jgi:hypothetical protein|nr:DUF2950 domain-containing protein [Methyloceanibacter sp.]